MYGAGFLTLAIVAPLILFGFGFFMSTNAYVVYFFTMVMYGVHSIFFAIIWASIFHKTNGVGLILLGMIALGAVGKSFTHCPRFPLLYSSDCDSVVKLYNSCTRICQFESHIKFVMVTGNVSDLDSLLSLIRISLLTGKRTP